MRAGRVIAEVVKRHESNPYAQTTHRVKLFSTYGAINRATSGPCWAFTVAAWNSSISVIQVLLLFIIWSLLKSSHSKTQPEEGKFLMLVLEAYSKYDIVFIFGIKLWQVVGIFPHQCQKEVGYEQAICSSRFNSRIAVNSPISSYALQSILI